MKASECITQNKYMITDEGDVICFFGEQDQTKGAFTLPLSDESDLQKTMKVTKQVLYDSVHSSQKQFVEKYEENFSAKSPLSAVQYFRILRSYVVDEKIPIPKKSKKSSTVTKDKSVSKGSRKDQVAQYLIQGIKSPTEIANRIGTNAGYVSRLIKQINESNT